MNPGPGTYTLPSEFGIYQAQKKYVTETERVEREKRNKFRQRTSIQTQGSTKSNNQEKL